MIYLVTLNQELFKHNEYKIIGVDESLSLLSKYKILQADSETSGKDPHICTLLLFQLGSPNKELQVVIDCTTIDIRRYKDLLESTYLIFQNGKFDLQFLYNYSIIPRKIYDTMIVEQLLYLGYPKGSISYALNAIAKRRLNQDIDKTVRGEIIWRGIDLKVIQYAANDVVYLYDIMQSQLKDCRERNCLVGAKLECNFVPVIAYLEWCGIHLDEVKWKSKMQKDLENLNKAKKDLDNFIINLNKNGLDTREVKTVLSDISSNSDNSSFSFEITKGIYIKPGSLNKFIYINTQGDLFNGFNLEPQCNINWSSSNQVIEVAKILGFNTQIQNKKTGEDKDSVMEKVLKKQKGINDEFLRLYLGCGEEGDDNYYAGYTGSAKVVTSFGQNHLNAINPYTKRIHTQYWQLGCDTGRMSSGSKGNNNDLAKLKDLPQNPSSNQKKDGKACPYPNMQQLPSDKITRSCFTAITGNEWCSCDYSAIESRLGADIYQEESMINEFLYGSGDMHSLCAYMVYTDIIPRDISIKDIKELYPHQRKEVKAIEFSQQFGGTAHAIQNAMGCTLEKAQEFANSYAKGFPGIAKFKEEASKIVRNKGYILLCPSTGHKTYWAGFNKWKETQASYTQHFWEEYKSVHKPNKDDVYIKVKNHFQEVSKFDRKSLNSPTQGTGAIILKDSQIDIFNWVVDNGLFGKCLLCNLTHDECNWEYPKEVKDFPNIVKTKMEESAAKYCKSIPIPAEASIGDHWIH